MLTNRRPLFQKRSTSAHCKSCSVTCSGAMTACVALMTFFQAKRFRPFRAGLFVALGLFGAVPASHAWLVTGPEIHGALQLNIAMGLTYLVSDMSHICNCIQICSSSVGGKQASECAEVSCRGRLIVFWICTDPQLLSEGEELHRHVHMHAMHV